MITMWYFVVKLSLVLGVSTWRWWVTIEPKSGEGEKTRTSVLEGGFGAAS